MPGRMCIREWIRTNMQSIPLVHLRYVHAPGTGAYGYPAACHPPPKKITIMQSFDHNLIYIRQRKRNASTYSIPKLILIEVRTTLDPEDATAALERAPGHSLFHLMICHLTNAPQSDKVTKWLSIKQDAEVKKAGIIVSRTIWADRSMQPLHTSSGLKRREVKARRETKREE